jgi:hypothetical protein
MDEGDSGTRRDLPLRRQRRSGKYAAPLAMSVWQTGRYDYSRELAAGLSFRAEMVGIVFRVIDSPGMQRAYCRGDSVRPCCYEA